jgi:cell division protein FtsB
MTELWTVIIILAATCFVYFFGFINGAILSNCSRLDLEAENYLLAGRNRELEAEIAGLKENDKILRFQTEKEEVINNN